MARSSRRWPRRLALGARRGADLALAIVRDRTAARKPCRSGVAGLLWMDALRAIVRKHRRRNCRCRKAPGAGPAVQPPIHRKRKFPWPIIGGLDSGGADMRAPR